MTDPHFGDIESFYQNHFQWWNFDDTDNKIDLDSNTKNSLPGDMIQSEHNHPDSLVCFHIQGEALEDVEFWGHWMMWKWNISMP